MNKFFKNGRDYTILRQEAVELFKRGMKCKEIAKQLNVCRHATARWLKDKDCVYSSVNKANINSNIFETINTQEKAYWLGFLFADGYVSRTSNFELSLGLKDISHLEKFKSFLEFEGKIYIDNKVGRCRLQFQDSKIVQDLKNKGCINKKSLILEFPTEDQVPREYISHFIRGYFDGDGSITDSKVSLAISLIGTFPFLKELSIITNLHLSKIKHRNKKHSLEVFTTEASGKVARAFCSFIYKDASVFLDRKYERYTKHLDKFNLWLKKILEI